MSHLYLKLMPDYRCHAIWWDIDAGATEMGNVDPASLGLSAQLVADLYAWAEEFDASLNWDDPAATVVDSEADAAFLARGKVLTDRVAAELGETATVRYVWDARVRPLGR